MLLFSVFLRVFAAVCNYMIFVVLGGFWNFLSSIFLVRSFSCVIFDTPNLTTTGSKFILFYQEIICPRHSFDAMPFFTCLPKLFWWFMNFLFGLPIPGTNLYICLLILIIFLTNKEKHQIEVQFGKLNYWSAKDRKDDGKT
jgi:hypothetical protein